jgi:16S rRNA (cytidine1402-2'-O)-methyltransferase
MIFYEAPHKLVATLTDLSAAFGPDRRITLCRELTKLHEEALRLTLGAALDYYAENAPRGEYVLILEGAKPAAQEGPSLEECLEKIAQLRDEGMSLKDAARQVSKESGIPRNTLYDAAVNG